MIENVTMGYFYYQDSLGNTSHVTDAAGNLLERYTYSAFGTPAFFNAVGTQLAGSAYGIRHLFNGQLWTQQTGLNDHRNRQAMPAMGVFLQPDPLGFAGGDSNLYRYCGNNPVNLSDPLGLAAGKKNYNNESGGVGGGSGTPTTGTVTVTDTPIFDLNGPFKDMQGWIDANSPRGQLGLPPLGNSTGSPGRISPRGLPRLATNSKAKGTVPNAPISTQGFWSDTSGFPTGPTEFILSDEWLARVLNEVIGRVDGQEARFDAFDIGWKIFMVLMDTEFWTDYHDATFSYNGMYTAAHGTWYGYQVNYIGVGAGFARSWLVQITNVQ